MSNDPLFTVAGQVVLASGGSRGIGHALAGGFVERGAQVIIAGRERETLEAAAEQLSTGEHPVRALVCDVARPEAVVGAVQELVDEFGRIDTLLNVAGVNKRMKVESYAMEEFDHIIDINLRGAFAMAQSVGKTMLARGAGNIINIDSLNTYGVLKGVTPYAMSKGGLSMMTRGMALEWGGRGVRVNAIAPGFFPTDISSALWAQPGMTEWAMEVTPLRRLGDLPELIGAAVFLASPAAFVTGQTIRVDGGVTTGFNWPIEL